MTRLDAEVKAQIIQTLPSEIHITQEDDVVVVENLSEDYDDGLVPVLVPEGANKAQFAKVGHDVLAASDEGTSWMEFQTDVWEVYREKYGVVTND